MRKLTDANQPCCVYKVTRIETGECYLGISVQPERRWRRQYTCRFGNALAKHGRKAFTWEVILELPSYRDAQLAEMCLIYVLEPAYNNTIGGDGRVGFRHTAETKAKMSAVRRGKPKPGLQGYKQTPQHIQNAARTRLGQKRSPEARERMSLAQKRRFAS